MVVTDAQVHIYEPDTPERPWPKEAGRTVAPPRHPISFSALEMLGAMEAIGVDRAVIIPPGWWGEDNSLALETAEKYSGRFAVMGRIDPYANGTEERLEGW